MNTAKKFAVWVGAFALVAFLSIEFAGRIMLSRRAKSVKSLVPLEFFGTADSRLQWEIITAAMESGPEGGYTLSNVDIERAKELVYVALTCAPEEWEGGDSVSASSATVRFLGEIYPEVKEQIPPLHSRIPLKQLQEILYQHPSQGWRIVRAGLSGRL
jgi:hypothetical protein